jgi:hypothetical protein
LVLFLGFSESGELIFKPDHTSVSSAKGQAIPSVVFVMFDELPAQSLLNMEAPSTATDFRTSLLWATWRPGTLSIQRSRHRPIWLSLQYRRDPIRTYSYTPRFGGYPNNFFSLLEPTHNLNAFETITRLCGMPACGNEVGAKSMIELLSDAVALYKLRFQIEDRTVGFICQSLTPLGRCNQMVLCIAVRRRSDPNFIPGR